jgi:hypothetical protein
VRLPSLILAAVSRSSAALSVSIIGPTASANAFAAFTPSVSNKAAMATHSWINFAS